MSRRERPSSALPPRGTALSRRSFLLSFDVDCGELVPGHRLIARGLSDVGHLDGPGWDESLVAPSVQGFALEYELVPGVPPEQGENVFRYLVRIEYEADVELPWEPADGGALAPFEGGLSTHGSRGDWPLPADARRLTFTMFGLTPGTTFPSEEASGELVVDLSSRSAEWHSR